MDWPLREVAHGRCDPIEREAGSPSASLRLQRLVSAVCTEIGGAGIRGEFRNCSREVEVDFRAEMLDDQQDGSEHSVE